METLLHVPGSPLDEVLENESDEGEDGEQRGDREGSRKLVLSVEDLDV